MLMGGQVKFRYPQNISGASQQSRVAAFSWTTEAAGDLSQNVRKNQKTNKKKQQQHKIS